MLATAIGNTETAGLEAMTHMAKLHVDHVAVCYMACYKRARACACVCVCVCVCVCACVCV